MSSPIVHVVDDEPMVSRAIARLLRSCDIEVETYQSPKEFLDRQPEWGPGCLILDLSMPEMDGLELQELLARTRMSLAIVFISGKADIASSVRAMKAGAVDFLTKPF